MLALSSLTVFTHVLPSSSLAVFTVYRRLPPVYSLYNVLPRDVRNFNMLLNMSDHVLIYCSWGQGTQKKFQHSTHSGNSGTSHAHFLAIPLTGKITKIALFTMMQLFNCLKTLFLQHINGRKAFCLMLASSLYDHCFTPNTPRHALFSYFLQIRS